MFDPDNKLNFRQKSYKEKLNDVLKPSVLVNLSIEEKTFVNKCKLSSNFRNNKVMHKKLDVIYEKLNL